MKNFTSTSRRQFLYQAGFGMLAYAGFPAWLRAKWPLARDEPASRSARRTQLLPIAGVVPAASMSG